MRRLFFQCTAAVLAAAALGASSANARLCPVGTVQMTLRVQTTLLPLEASPQFDQGGPQTIIKVTDEDGTTTLQQHLQAFLQAVKVAGNGKAPDGDFLHFDGKKWRATAEPVTSDGGNVSFDTAASRCFQWGAQVSFLDLPTRYSYPWGVHDLVAPGTTCQPNRTIILTLGMHNDATRADADAIDIGGPWGDNRYLACIDEPAPSKR